MGSKSIAQQALDARGVAAPARDGNIAVREEYEMAVKCGTIKCYDLFIRRHPDHLLADKAQRWIEKMRRGRHG